VGCCACEPPEDPHGLYSPETGGLDVEGLPAVLSPVVPEELPPGWGSFAFSGNFPALAPLDPSDSIFFDLLEQARKTNEQEMSNSNTFFTLTGKLRNFSKKFNLGI
jgi:hypothetical protein